MATYRPDGPRRTATGYHVPAGAQLPGLTGSRPGTRLVVGANARVAAIRHAGAVELQREAACDRLEAGQDVLLATGCRVPGGVRAGGRVVVQAGAVVGPIDAGSDVLLLGDCVVGDVACKGDVLLDGAPRTGTLAPAGRVTRWR
ncbi:MAG TPA: hypothetical protein VFH47_08455 [Candidatus Thermoplasmatota archaeon]|nr:hypothetical protein [Candidatus Thermoplasmatota archaeon]